MIRTASFFTFAIALALLGCADQQAPEHAEPPAPQINEAQPITQQALPAWEPHIEPYGLVSEEGKQWFYADAKETFGESPEDAGDYYDILGVGCSWYCGGEAENATASSTLPDDGPYTYVANNAHDLSYATAWVEGVEGPGIGETLTYTFTHECPRITKMYIHTGYTKDEITWIKNNRARTLELAINGKPTALIQLADTRAEQSFDFKSLGLGPLGRRPDGQPLILTFTIRAVYPGTIHDDTAITEIYFDGIDVH